MNAKQLGPPLHNGHAEWSVPAVSEFEQRMRVLELSVELLIARTNMGDFWMAGFQECGNLLASVPMPTLEFVSANRHLENAISYCRQREFGAGAFELRALRGSLQRL
jgi:hypothetical protein